MNGKWVKIKGRDLMAYENGDLWALPFVDRAGRSRKLKKLTPVITHSSYNRGYAQLSLSIDGKNHCFYWHRIIAKAFLPEFKTSLQVDHRDGDRSNNQPSNLRMATPSQNRRGFCKICKKASSQFRGVSKCSTRKKWYAQGWDGSKKQNLGYYDNEIDAAKAFDVFAKSHGYKKEALNFK